jgi:hypothetical protein
MMEMTQSGQPDKSPFDLSDIVVGAGEMAMFLFGENNQKTRLRIYRLIATRSKDRLPHFRMGTAVVTKREHLVAWALRKKKEMAATIVDADAAD